LIGIDAMHRPVRQRSGFTHVFLTHRDRSGLLLNRNPSGAWSA
jgi:hypothetical protein